ncbi:ABC transporter ATP-binding protein [bacterium]|nr:ABC transporter ATP-binding protein [bacterium]QQR57453.1 MAG: ABC transporter ATP-binding protein [Candidatus Melainabacteria bacterium]
MAELALNPVSPLLDGQGILIDSVVKSFKPSIRNIIRMGNRKRVLALNEISLKVLPGEALGVIGPNGAGKTTLMGCLLGFLRPEKGSIYIEGLPPESLHIKKLIGYLPERLTFDRWMTAIEFVSYHHELAGMPQDSRQQDVEELLTKVGLDSNVWTSQLSRFSRGMLQRLGLAQSLIGKPKYLFLDEPVSGVDPGGALQIRQVLSELKKSGMTIVVNSHQLDQVEKICDRVVFVNKGRVEAVEDLLEPDHQRRLVLIKFDSHEGELPDAEKLGNIARQCGAEVTSFSFLHATVEVRDNKALVTLVKTLVSENHPVLEVVPQSGRLERFFMEGKS